MAETIKSWKKPMLIVGLIVCGLILIRSGAQLVQGIQAVSRASSEREKVFGAEKSDLSAIYRVQLEEKLAWGEVWAAVPIAGGAIKRAVENSSGVRKLREQIVSSIETDMALERATRLNEQWARENQISFARLNNATESEIMRIESQQRQGGSEQAQEWIEGYEGGRLGKRSTP